MKGGSQIGLEKLRISLNVRDDLAKRETQRHASRHSYAAVHS